MVHSVTMPGAVANGSRLARAEEPDMVRQDRGSGERIRVMHVMYRLQPGGMELGVVKLVNGLRGSRIVSSICSSTPAVDKTKALVNGDVEVHELKRRDGNDPGFVRDLYALFKRERPHIVHTHAWGTLVEGLVAARLARVPIVVHGEHGTLQLRGLQPKVQRFMWGRATKVLSVSRKLAERMTAQTRFPADRITTIQNGVDFSRFSPALRAPAREDLGLGPAEVAVGTAGRLVDVKNQASLVDALARLARDGVRCVGLIAGDGPLRSALETQITGHGLNGRVRLLGHRTDVERLFAALDVFVLPSKSEGMSNTILEAMASGVPIVATNVGGAEELVDDGSTGFLVPAGNTEALADAIANLVANPARRLEMGTAGRVKAHNQFSLDRMVSDYAALYVGLAQRLIAGASA